MRTVCLRSTRGVRTDGWMDGISPPFLVRSLATRQPRALLFLMRMSQLYQMSL